MQGIQPVYESISNKIHNGVEDIGNKVSGGIQQIISGLDASVISDHINKGANYVEKVGKDVNDGIKRVGKVSKDVSKGVNEGMKQLISVLDALVPDIFKNVDFTNTDWNKVSPIIVRNIDEKARFLSNAIKDPEIRKALHRSIQIYGKVIKEVYHLDEPLIQEMTDRILETMNTISEKTAKNASNALIQTGMAAVAEIPGLGGAIDLLVAFGKWYNTASGIIAPSILQIQDTTHKTIQMGKDGMAVAKKYDTDIRAVQKELNDAVDHLQTKAANLQRTMPLDRIQTGGKRTKRQKANKTAKRLGKSISTFTRYKPIF